MHPDSPGARNLEWERLRLAEAAVQGDTQAREALRRSLTNEIQGTPREVSEVLTLELNLAALRV